MTIKDLIKDKDYDCINIRTNYNLQGEDLDILLDVCKSTNGKLISLTDDYFAEDTEIIEVKEWDSTQQYNVNNGIDIYVKSSFIKEDLYETACKRYCTD